MQVLGVLNRTLQPELYSGDDRTLRMHLLALFFEESVLEDPAFHLDPTDTLEVDEGVQNLLDKGGASVLVIELVMVSDHVPTFYEALQLGINLLEDGNVGVQESFYNYLRSRDSTAFFAKIQEKMAKSKLDLKQDEDAIKREKTIDDHTCMEAILRLLQLLCEGHNAKLQNYLRAQRDNKTSYNLVLETIKYLDYYGLAVQLNDANVANVIQVRQGPAPAGCKSAGVGCARGLR